MSLIEIMVVLAIVGILAAVAIPAFSRYRFEAGLSEAFTNIQGIVEAQQAYYARFQRYTLTPDADHPPCPPDAVEAVDPNLAKQTFDPAACGGTWLELGWTPDGPVAFQYNYFTSYDSNAALAYLPATNDAPGMADSGTWGVDWAVELGVDVDAIQPWVAVEAFGDTDRQNGPVTIRTNSYNYTAYRFPPREY